MTPQDPSPSATEWKCPRCNGTGEFQNKDAHWQLPCPTCGGEGKIGGYVGQTPEQFDVREETCPDCNGTGLAPSDLKGGDEPCPHNQDDTRWMSQVTSPNSLAGSNAEAERPTRPPSAPAQPPPAGTSERCRFHGRPIPCEACADRERKLGKMWPREVKHEVCENCHNQFKVVGESCFQCGHSVRVGENQH